MELYIYMQHLSCLLKIWPLLFMYMWLQMKIL